MNNLPLKALKWHEQEGWFSTKSPLTEYRVVSSGDKYKVFYAKRSDKHTREATGFATIDDAKTWCWGHYQDKMQPWLAPDSANALVGMPPEHDLVLKRDVNQWIDVNERLPSDDGKYLTLRKGFTYNMGNENDLEPHVGYWNGGLGCFDEDYDNALFTHWMPLPESPIKQG